MTGTKSSPCEALSVRGALSICISLFRSQPWGENPAPASLLGSAGTGTCSKHPSTFVYASVDPFYIQALPVTCRDAVVWRDAVWLVRTTEHDNIFTVAILKMIPSLQIGLSHNCTMTVKSFSILLFYWRCWSSSVLLTPILRSSFISSLQSTAKKIKSNQKQLDVTAAVHVCFFLTQWHEGGAKVHNVWFIRLHTVSADNDDLHSHFI